MGESVAVSDGRTDGVIGSFFRRPFGSLKSVFVNRNLRRMQLAFTGSLIGNWAYATAVSVWAYGVGGAKAVGIFIAIRLAVMALATPFVSTFADKYPRKLVMIYSDLYCAVLIALATICLYAGTPSLPIFVLATLTAFGGSSFRAAQGAITPQLANTTEELTASNGTASTLESLAIFVGPAIGAGLLAVADVEIVFLLNVVSFLWSMFMVVGHPRGATRGGRTRTPSPSRSRKQWQTAAEAEEEKAEGFISRDLGRVPRDLAATRTCSSPWSRAPRRRSSPAPPRCSPW